MTDQQERLPADATTPDPDFVTRVMASVATGPGPSAPRSFAGALRARSGTEASAAVAVAWHLAVRARSVPTVVRVQGFALVLAVALVAGAGVTFAATAAYRVAAPIVVAVTDRVLDDERVIPVAAPTASPRPVEPTPEPPEAVTPPEHGSDYDDADRPRGAIGTLPDDDAGAAVDPTSPTDDDADEGDHRTDDDDEGDGDDADRGGGDDDDADESDSGDEAIDEDDADGSEVGDDGEAGEDDGADDASDEPDGSPAPDEADDDPDDAGDTPDEPDEPDGD